MRHEFSRRRLFQDLALDAVAGVSLWQMPHLARGESLAPDRPLLKPLVDQVICPWSSRHPRHDHQLIFPLDDERLLMVWSEYYASDGKEARLVSVHTFTSDWPTWEMHPVGAELVYVFAGRMTLIQEDPDGTRREVVLAAGQAAINPPGVWHTAKVAETTTALFITAGEGTLNEVRD